MASSKPIKAKFELSVKDFNAALKKEIGIVTSLIGTNVYNQLIEATPVDTGRARISWSIRGHLLELPYYGEENDIFFQLGQPEQRTFFPFPTNSQDMGEMAKLNKFYIGNTAHYIQGLNQGWSPKAPTPGWIELSVLDGVEAAISEYKSYNETKLNI